jgi:hypothetical protein
MQMDLKLCCTSLILHFNHFYHYMNHGCFGYRFYTRIE